MIGSRTHKECPSKTIFKKKKKNTFFPRATVHRYNARDGTGPRSGLRHIKKQKRVKRPGWTAARATLGFKEGDLVEAKTCCKKLLPTKVQEVTSGEIVLADLPRCLPKRTGRGRRLVDSTDGEKSECQQKNHDLDTLERKQRAEREKLLRRQRTVPAAAVRHRDYLVPGEITDRNYMEVLCDQVLPLFPAAKKGDLILDLGEDSPDRVHIVREKEGALSLSILHYRGGRTEYLNICAGGVSLGPKYPVGFWHRAKYASGKEPPIYGCKEPVHVSIWGLITEEDLTEIPPCTSTPKQPRTVRQYSWGTLCFPAKKSVVISGLSRLKNQGAKLLLFDVDQPDGMAHLDLNDANYEHYGDAPYGDDFERSYAIYEIFSTRNIG